MNGKNFNEIVRSCFQDWPYEYFKDKDAVEILQYGPEYQYSQKFLEEHIGEYARNSKWLTAITNGKPRIAAQVRSDLEKAGFVLKEETLDITLYENEFPESAQVHDCHAFLERLSKVDQKIDELRLSAVHNKVYLIIPTIYRYSKDENGSAEVSFSLKYFIAHNE